jgi:hypothetical protein
VFFHFQLSQNPHVSQRTRDMGHPASLIRDGRRRSQSRLACCILLACTLSACKGDRRESFYPSLADARRDGATDRGWMPDFLPESSRSIHELHDLSPSTQWCAFEFLPAEAAALHKRLKSDGSSVPSVRRVPDPGKPWWPAVLAGDFDAKKIHESGLDLFLIVEPETASTKEVLLVAIDWVKGRGFFYRTPVS